jgi:predicted DNA-binding transcriptional regulator AlpA
MRNSKQKNAEAAHEFAPDRVLSAHEVMALFGITRMTLDSWCRKGRLPAKRRVGIRKIGFLRSEIDARLRSLETV